MTGMACSCARSFDVRAVSSAKLDMGSSGSGGLIEQRPEFLEDSLAPQTPVRGQQAIRQGGRLGHARDAAHARVVGQPLVRALDGAHDRGLLELGPGGAYEGA